MQLRALWLLDEIIRMTPRNDVRLGYLTALREQIETDEAMMEEAKKVIAEFEEAYTKLTSPANSIGVFLGKVEPEKKAKPRRRFGIPTDQEPEKPAQTVRIALGDKEYIANVDPKLENPEFKVGTQVKVNEAFAVIGDLGFSLEGPIVKISEVLPNGRLRVSMDAQGMSSPRCLSGRTAARRDPEAGLGSAYGAELQVRSRALLPPKRPWTSTSKRCRSCPGTRSAARKRRSG